MTAHETAWVVGSALVVAVAALSVLRRIPATVRAALAVFVLAVVIVLGALDLYGLDVRRPLHVLGAAAVSLLGVVGGSVVTGAVLDLAMRDGVERGQHGGILVARADDPSPARPRPEVLRGGTAIGFLERFAIVGAVLVGHVEVVAAVIAVKGLGRFSELDTATARERFIIGTLTSTSWAGAAAVAAVMLR